MAAFELAGAAWSASTVASTGLPLTVAVPDDAVTTGTTWTRSPGARSGGNSPAFERDRDHVRAGCHRRGRAKLARGKERPCHERHRDGPADHARLVGHRHDPEPCAGRDPHRPQIA